MQPDNNAWWLGLERAIDALTRATLKGQSNIKQISFQTLMIDGAGGGANTGNYGTEVLFTAASPGGFARQSVRVPNDYKVNTDLTIRMYVSANNGSTNTFNYYMGIVAQGASVASPWNVASNATYASATYPANLIKELVFTIPAAQVSVAALVAFAIKPVSSTPNISFYGAILEYQAS